MNDTKLDALEAACHAKLDQIERKHLEAVAWYDSLTERSFANPEKARLNIDRLHGRLGLDETMNVIERGDVFDWETRTRVTRKFDVGELKPGGKGEQETISRLLYEIRDAWKDVELHAEKYDKARHELRLVLEEKARRQALAERAVGQPRQGELRDHDQSRSLKRSRSDG